MCRFVSIVCIVAIGWSAPLAGQDRPNYSGRWSLVEDRGTSSAPRALGRDFTVDQSPTVVRIERAVTLMSLPVRGGPPGSTEAFETQISRTFICDGAEHESSFVTTYRATWTPGRLIILTQNRSGQGSNKGAITSVNRLALSLDADGALIVDSLDVPMIPNPNGPKREPPVTVRSVYKKVQ